MPTAKDPTQALKEAAAAFPDVVEGVSCNQSSFKVGKKAFFYIGPGAKGVGFKAMFKLGASMDEAQVLAKDDPDRFGIGTGNWVSVRFTAEKPLPKKVWGRWLKESYADASGSGRGAKKKGAARKKA